MTITLLQTDIKWAEAEVNQSIAESLIIKAPKSDVYVLPEMFSTGFAVEPDGVAEADNATLQWMQRMSERMDAAVAGSVAVRVNGEYYNRFYFVKPDGNVCQYDKHHLFTYGGENKFYSPGKERQIVEWRGVKFLLQVCYDLRFPVYSRNLLNVNNEAAYDCILYVANWPTSRRRIWDALLVARAMENQAYVVGVNRVGDDTVCSYNGGSIVIDAYGKTIAAAQDGQQLTITAQIDMDRLSQFRKKFPVLADADYTLPVY